jgi:hypothetical protein
MSRELGWKQFQSDDPDSPDPVESAPVPSYLGEGVRAPIPWSGASAATGEAPVASATATAAPELAAGSPSQPVRAAAAPPRRLPFGELVWLCLAVVDALLALDFLLRALAARASGVVGVVNRVGNLLAKPFDGVFNRPGVPRVDHTTFWAALVAIVVYTVAAWIVIRLLRLVAAPAPQSVPPS